MDNTANTQLNYCYSCMQPLQSGVLVCPLCGHDNSSRSNADNALPEGTILNGKYLVGKTLGQGGFGITYLGIDLILDVRVAIKEYFPSGVGIRSKNSIRVVPVPSLSDADGFEKGCREFQMEAKTLAQFNSPNVVHVRDYFHENGTAYIVMDFIDGNTLTKEVEEKGGKIPWKRVLDLFKPLILELDKLHKKHLIHRDIKPENLKISVDENGNEHLVLLDFGAARSFVSAQVTKTYTAMVTPGFAPIEQYSPKSRQGPYTDIYALCATMYAAITGDTPAIATDRVIGESVLETFGSLGLLVPEQFEKAVFHGLEPLSADRPQTMRELYEELTVPSLSKESKFEKGFRIQGPGTRNSGFQDALVNPDSDIKNKKTSLEVPSETDGTAEKSEIRRESAETAGALSINYRQPMESAEKLERPQNSEKEYNQSPKERSSSETKKNKWLLVLIPILLLAGGFFAFQSIRQNNQNTSHIQTAAAQQELMQTQELETQSARDAEITRAAQERMTEQRLAVQEEGTREALLAAETEVSWNETKQAELRMTETQSAHYYENTQTVQADRMEQTVQVETQWAQNTQSARDAEQTATAMFAEWDAELRQTQTQSALNIQNTQAALIQQTEQAAQTAVAQERTREAELHQTETQSWIEMRATQDAAELQTMQAAQTAEAQERTREAALHQTETQSYYDTSSTREAALQQTGQAVQTAAAWESTQAAFSLVQTDISLQAEQTRTMWALTRDAGNLILTEVVQTQDAFNATQTKVFEPTATGTPRLTDTPQPTAANTPQLTVTFTPTQQGPFIYVVQEYDNCWSIISQFGVPLDLFLAINNLPSTCPISIGDELVIPAPYQEMPTPTPIPLDQYVIGQQIEYTVQVNDSYPGIASKFNTTLDSIQRLNDIEDITSYPTFGQVLTIAVNLVTPTPVTADPVTPTAAVTERVSFDNIPMLIALADDAYSSEDYESASKLYQKAAALGGEDAEIMAAVSGIKALNLSASDSAEVITDTLLRSEPSSSGLVVRSLLKGSSVTQLIEKSGSWIRVQTEEGQQGWIHESSVTLPVNIPVETKYITFGHYEQDNDLNNGTEPVEWQVLRVEKNRALVISRYALDSKKFDVSNGNQWETSTLRRWLNGDFRSSIFSNAEQRRLIEVSINNEYGSNGGEPTQDYIFLLSVDEVNKYFASNDARKCDFTPYSKAAGRFSITLESAPWWLRSPGTDSVALVRVDGSMNTDGIGAQSIETVRPAFWLDLNVERTPGTITFGHYEQDNNSSNGPEAIEWQVLAAEDNRVLLISRYALDTKRYNDTRTPVTWETSSLRQWLNGEFFESAFSSAEKSLIAEVINENPDNPIYKTDGGNKTVDNPIYKTDGGNKTVDKVFLLSIDEAQQFISSDEKRKCEATAYANANGAREYEKYGTSQWWLRSPGYTDVAASRVLADGEVTAYGNHVDSDSGVVRPALWLNFSVGMDEMSYANVQPKSEAAQDLHVGETSSTVYKIGDPENTKFTTSDNLYIEICYTNDGSVIWNENYYAVCTDKNGNDIIPDEPVYLGKMVDNGEKACFSFMRLGDNKTSLGWHCPAFRLYTDTGAAITGGYRTACFLIQ